MFGDGKAKVITHDGDLYINMWDLTEHLMNSAYMLDSVGGGDAKIISDTMRVISSTLCDLALYELGMEEIDSVSTIEDARALWEKYGE